MATTVTKEARFDSSNAKTYATAEMNVLARDDNFVYVYLNNDSYEDVYLIQAGKDLLFPTSTAKPYRLDNSMRYRRTIGGTGHFYFYIDGTEVHQTSTSSNSYTTDEKTNITVSAVTNCTSSSEFRWYVGIDRTTRGAALLWDDVKFYFYQYTCTATAGKGITSATVSNASPYSGETVTFSCTLSANFFFDGWYDSNGTLISTSQTFTINAADLNLTAKTHPHMWVKTGANTWTMGVNIWKKESSGWVHLVKPPSDIQDGQKVIHRE